VRERSLRQRQRPHNLRRRDLEGLYQEVDASTAPPTSVFENSSEHFYRTRRPEKPSSRCDDGCQRLTFDSYLYKRVVMGWIPGQVGSADGCSPFRPYAVHALAPQGYKPVPARSDEEEWIFLFFLGPSGLNLSNAASGHRSRLMLRGALHWPTATPRRPFKAGSAVDDDQQVRRTALARQA